MQIKKVMGAGVAVLGLTMQPAFAENADEWCPKIGELAELIMTKRQEGAAMSALRAVLATEADNPVHSLANIMITDAYGRNRYSSDSVRLETIQDFRNDYELKCYNTMK